MQQQKVDSLMFALGRNIPQEEAVKCFQYSFGILLEGLKK